MLISELIDKLNKIKYYHGDIEVVCGDIVNCYSEIDEVTTDIEDSKTKAVILINDWELNRMEDMIRDEQQYLFCGTLDSLSDDVKNILTDFAQNFIHQIDNLYEDFLKEIDKRM